MHKASQPECPGEGRCHGCLGWCDFCGTVSHVCDSAECDWHRRPEEVEADLAAVRAEMRLTARKDWERERTEVEGLQPTQSGAPWNPGQNERAFRSWLRSAASEFRLLEKNEGELEEELDAVVKAGPALSPRRPPEAEEREDGRQLPMFR